MPIDPRLTALGYSPVAKPAGRRRRMFISTEGMTATGKTYFQRTMPPPQVCIDFDRGMEGVAEVDLWGNEIIHKIIEMPDLDIGGVLPTPAELKLARDGYIAFKELMHKTLQALDAMGGGTLSVETGGAAYSLAQIARFGQLGQIGEVPRNAWDPMKAEFSNIFLEYEQYTSVNLLVTHHQGAKYGALGEKDLKGYKDIANLAQVHLAFERRFRRNQNGAVIRNANGAEEFDLVRKVVKCRQRLSLIGAEFPVVFLDDDMRESIGGDFLTVAQAVFPDTTVDDWMPTGLVA